MFDYCMDSFYLFFFHAVGRRIEPDKWRYRVAGIGDIISTRVCLCRAAGISDTKTGTFCRVFCVGSFSVEDIKAGEMSKTGHRRFDYLCAGGIL